MVYYDPWGDSREKPGLPHMQRFKKFPLASSQSGVVIKYLVEIKYMYYHRSRNKNIGQGVCKFGIIGKWNIYCIWDNGKDFGNFEEFLCQGM